MKIFLSYSHNDTNWASEFCRFLEQKKIQVWRDITKTAEGDLIETKISQALSESAAFCVLISNASKSSKWVRLELSSALSRWSIDSSFKFIPILLEKDALPSLLGGMLYIKGFNLSPKKVAENIISSIAIEPTKEIQSIDWEPLLTAIERDQYTDLPGAYNYGGWSRSYPLNYLPLAFPKQVVPDSVAHEDSITVTHWVVRGLFSLRRILMRTSKDSKLIPKIDKLLVLAQDYLLRHFDGKGAGLIRKTAEGEKIYKDIRHSATFAKALFQFGYEDFKKISTSINFALSNIDYSDGRASTYAELLHISGLLKRHPDIRPKSFTAKNLDLLRNKLENALKSKVFSLKGEKKLGKLFFIKGQEHMSLFYSWWVLDACGEILSESKKPKMAQLVSEVLLGFQSFEIAINNDYSGFPLILYGGPDLGATCKIGEVLLRFCPANFISNIDKITSFVFNMIEKQQIDKYIHHEFLWSVPNYVERYMNVIENRVAVGF